MSNRLKILLLAGTREAREIALGLSGHDVIASFAGVTRAPQIVASQVRRGGFGGVEGLIAHLNSARYDLVIDATHPFAQVMTGNAVAACRATGTPLFHVLRPAWEMESGENWLRVETLAAAAAALPERARTFLATGSRSLGSFASRRDIWFLVRVIVEPTDNPIADCEVIVGRPPFSIGHEVDLLRRAEITHLVARNAGGGDGMAKLVAARQLEVQVVMVGRPPPPPGEITTSVGQALASVKQIAERAG